MAKKRKSAVANAKGESQRGVVASRRRTVAWIAAVVVAGVALVVANAAFDGGGRAAASPVKFSDVRAQTKEFMGYYNSIQLTPEQELVKQQALTRIAAPCCSDNTAHTCCCPCNMAKTWWGLSNHLIADKGYGADQVQAAVEGWIEFINPDGFSGNACYTGGCVRPFERNGCGGMDENQVVF